MICFLAAGSFVDTHKNLSLSNFCNFFFMSQVLGPMCAGAIWSLLQTQDITPFLKVAGTYWTFAIIGISPVIAASKLPKVYQVSLIDSSSSNYD